MITLASGVGPTLQGATVKLYLAIPLVLMALLIAASGIAAVSRGWVLPMNRRHVRAPQLYGWGQLVVAFALCWQLVFGLVISDSGTRPTGTLIGGVILLVGLVVMMVGQLAGGNGKGRNTP
ncbi:hypothetical protein DWB77_06683 [Streptomyces hundungensis]|uniref:Uncharacterized protein n=1 Tax=Streptomyces hundungensis TaxID=1077946 RepID=A0A387H383_9ACTN|nr:hypothetical protein [Streptomyces hundungensis]AYG78135.1 hypothetical protein DWB77_00242 [Streptomyces hundungensis]AYG78325.1 hypothetical protein DWB77_00432 [Streptomyces hundungensis]AYG78405.1 hypothetical protein DWB77_00512 [Streptomyces hundungensis]AYG83995.1 hypothetical protein DWB77_06197 [Streptomyces hundungensis]AYG84469.1 hypothetical protein DWB77_06683 [Streptomyces hundungensis]